ncbi:DUF2225 domain-containing protein [Paenibacillus validus]|uniref:DUF2225 domain-containing protein n=1 Tax=Paenibacillus validus TaxID=44253 RepID=A0A7X2ZBM6_9BACL|nr:MULTISPECIES: DUF2225 domain-containing protein [Paenibacillus]MED4603809.1 DUF2225 domain-containing protein [Paenibacillus validus]MED4607969.1 DUF2225 domain-containing protein [Paenibacillus validus]MUG71146.1 DUF2225 domain-containing protein [Paenibacillus validus]
MMEPLFQAKVQCPQCDAEFRTSRVRPSFKKSIKSDTDFCLHYKDLNPDYYVVRICPFCGFAGTENSKEHLTLQQKNAFKEKIGAKWSYKDCGGERQWDDALYAFKLALVCAQAVNEKGRVTASLLHHIAWLYRHQGNEEQEKRFLQYALEEYIRTFETEASEMNNARLMYLIGELHRRLKNFNQAVKWFARVVNDKQIMDAGMIRACREQWQAVREEMQEQKLQLEEDVQEL